MRVCARSMAIVVSSSERCVMVEKVKDDTSCREMLVLSLDRQAPADI